MDAIEGPWDLKWRPSPESSRHLQHARLPSPLSKTLQDSFQDVQDIPPEKDKKCQEISSESLSVMCMSSTPAIIKCEKTQCVQAMTSLASHVVRYCTGAE